MLMLSAKAEKANVVYPQIQLSLSSWVSCSCLFLVRMVSRKQKRVWRYVEEGSLLKLKSYLRKHRDLDVNFSQGKRERGPLHLACCLGDDAVLRLLLKHGADVLQRDRKGDTALHTAANRALKHGKTGNKDRGTRGIIKVNSHLFYSGFCFVFASAYVDLVVPLKKSCPEALTVPNSAGVTPEDLLNWLRQKEVTKDIYITFTKKCMAAN